MNDIDPSAVMAAHAYHTEDETQHACREITDEEEEPCEPYRLAEALAFARAQWKVWQDEDAISREALAASVAKVARVQALIDSGECGEEDRWREAISNQPEQAS